LPTIGDIRNEIAKQNIAIISGDYEETGLIIGAVGTGNDPKQIDPALEKGSTTATIVRGQGSTFPGNVRTK
jgi:hypothetical protein